MKTGFEIFNSLSHEFQYLLENEIYKAYLIDDVVAIEPGTPFSELFRDTLDKDYLDLADFMRNTIYEDQTEPEVREAFWDAYENGVGNNGLPKDPKHARDIVVFYQKTKNSIEL